jgi:hypothetical protein
MTTTVHKNHVYVGRVIHQPDIPGRFTAYPANAPGAMVVVSTMEEAKAYLLHRAANPIKENRQLLLGL